MQIGLPVVASLREIGKAVAEAVPREIFPQFIREVLQRTDDEGILVETTLTLVLEAVRNSPVMSVDNLYHLAASLEEVLMWIHEHEDVIGPTSEEERENIVAKTQLFLAKFEKAREEAEDHNKLIQQKRKYGTIQ